MMKQVMKRAWELAKSGVKKFGGKVREYLAASLSIAWKEVKNMGEKLAELVGTEKQVKWANDIRARIESVKPQLKEKFISELEKMFEGKTSEKHLNIKNTAKESGLSFIENLDNDTRATYYINAFSWVRSESDAFKIPNQLMIYKDVTENINKFAKLVFERRM